MGQPDSGGIEVGAHARAPLLDLAASYYGVEQWRTVASDYPRRRIGDWAILDRQQPPGLYAMQGRGRFYFHTEPINLTVLVEGQKVWFTDEPRQMYALAEIGLFRAQGRVVVGGLGLGLIHYFLRANPNVTSVITIERGQELQALVWPYVKLGDLVIGDFYDVLPTLAGTVDTIITDFIFGYQADETWRQLKEQQAFCHQYCPGALFLEHGYQRQLDAEQAHRSLPASALNSPGDKVVIFK